MLQSAEELWSRAVPDDRSAEQTLYLEGVSNLLSGADAGDRTRLREMLSALGGEGEAGRAAGAYVDSHERSVRVVFNMEERAPEMHGLVLVAAPAMIDGARRGTVGVIGTQRMHYENTINAVGYVAQLFALSLGDEASSSYERARAGKMFADRYRKWKGMNGTDEMETPATDAEVMAQSRRKRQRPRQAAAASRPFRRPSSTE